MILFEVEVEMSLPETFYRPGLSGVIDSFINSLGIASGSVGLNGSA
jgi:hypothetical protein